jgi:hypothetical protein
MKKEKIHPLVDINEKHYINEDTGTTTIEDFENKYTIDQLQSWAMITEDKYRSRLGKKGGKDGEEKDKIKINKYKKYNEMLLNIKNTYPGLTNISAKKVYKILNENWKYK